MEEVEVEGGGGCEDFIFFGFGEGNLRPEGRRRRRRRRRGRRWWWQRGGTKTNPNGKT